ncbi:hypothetical protein CISG_07816 [Coccidioides immitis RMSCC 3703]|uniref:Uncharacterized protein n=1 Tax=Coccidioides immitis RMSCC 3703 TaxID=454286 RepID=A0A0J8R4G2_COCIT|nr:hypothetical protein CISG_07816 [Coccidioides immitis RMSCC 3703]
MRLNSGEDHTSSFHEGRHTFEERWILQGIPLILGEKPRQMNSIKSWRQIHKGPRHLDLGILSDVSNETDKLFAIHFQLSSSNQVIQHTISSTFFLTLLLAPTNFTTWHVTDCLNADKFTKAGTHTP